LAPSRNHFGYHLVDDSTLPSACHTDYVVLVCMDRILVGHCRLLARRRYPEIQNRSSAHYVHGRLHTARSGSGHARRTFARWPFPDSGATVVAVTHWLE